MRPSHERRVPSLRLGLPALCAVLCVAAGSVEAATQLRTEVSQYGITFQFASAAQTGTFANGDSWVLGPVAITRITPDAAGGRHGWDVNPSDTVRQPYDSRMNNFASSLMPALPYTAQPGSSIVKTMSTSGSCPGPGQPCLQTAAVLTVLGAVPPDDGATVFRPGYFGSSKRLFSTKNLRLDLLPSVPPSPDTPTLADIRRRFERVWLDRTTGWSGRSGHPAENMRDYGAEIGMETGDGALRLMLNDPIAQKMPALIAYVQVGIDFYNARRGGIEWYANGGHGQGRKLPITFAAVMLDDADMKAAVSQAPYDTFSEDGQIFYSQKANGGNGMILWGTSCGEDAYWRARQGTGPADCRDPYGYIDGHSYQECCSSLTWKATALALHLMPSLQPVWNNNLFQPYVDRWVTFGKWRKPDPCSFTQPSTYTGQCVAGSGRAPEEHATFPDFGAFSSDFAASMWITHRNNLPNPTPDTQPPSPPVLLD